MEHDTENKDSPVEDTNTRVPGVVVSQDADDTTPATTSDNGMSSSSLAPFLL